MGVEWLYYANFTTDMWIYSTWIKTGLDNFDVLWLDMILLK